jgi:hypothetical protein
MISESRGPRKGSNKLPTSLQWLNGGVQEQGDRPGKSITRTAQRMMK